MPGLEIRPFSDEHFDDAARLLAERHERHRAAEPLIPGDVDYRVQIEEALGAEGASGVAAITQGELNAYLVGQVSEDDRAVVDFAGHAAAHAELLRDLYADLARAWVDAGCVRHAVYVPASDGALIDAWFRLGFGLHADGRRVP